AVYDVDICIIISFLMCIYLDLISSCTFISFIILTFTFFPYTTLFRSIPNFASLCRGRSLVRGREPLPGRTRTSDSSYRLAMSVEHLLPHLCKARQGLCGGFNVVDFYAFNAQTNNCAGGSHAVIGIRLPQPTVQRSRVDF